MSLSPKDIQYLLEHSQVTKNNSNCKWNIQSWNLVTENACTTVTELPEICNGCKVLVACMSQRVNSMMDYTEEGSFD